VRQNPYENVRYLTEYLLFHYGRPGDLCPLTWVPRRILQFHTRLRRECLLPLSPPSGSLRTTRGLDLGCGVGRFTFELGRVVSQSIGIDSSKSFVRAARKMAKDGELTIQAPDCGSRFRNVTVQLPSNLRRAQPQFGVGDAMDATALAVEPFDIVAAINLICRLPRPRAFLRQLHQLVAPGGQLLLASPFSWMPEYSPPGQWLMPQDVRQLLQGHFRLKRRKSLPFIIREHRRKFQLVVSEAMLFIRT
jgi:SAM-dependent methyltransferase